jgi:cobalt-zinc-cadmium resistance protein CzcA
MSAMAERIDAEAPGALLTFTQPIEMRFNEMLEGITSDVGVQLYGDDLAVLDAFGLQVVHTLQGIEGAADVKLPAVEGVPSVDVNLDPAALGRLGLTASEALLQVEALRRGRAAAEVQRGGFRDPLVLRLALPTAVALDDLPIVRPQGGHLTLGDVAEVRPLARPAVVRRHQGSRRVVVQANVRGRDVGGFVAEARAKIAALERPRGVWITWSGKAEQLATALARTAVTVPIALLGMFLLLRIVFGNVKDASLILLSVPMATSGGLFALALRGLPLSMSAIVGFIALSGVAVMNGVVLLARTRELGIAHPPVEAARLGASERMRPVLGTALVAGIGFLPMALATGLGAEVQRPLATVVIGGLLTATPLTLMVLPGLAAWTRSAAGPAAPEAA